MASVQEETVILTSKRLQLEGQLLRNTKIIIFLLWTVQQGQRTEQKHYERSTAPKTKQEECETESR